MITVAMNERIRKLYGQFSPINRAANKVLHDIIINHSLDLDEIL